MATTEEDCRAIAAEFPTPNVTRAIALAESGRLTWDQVHDLLARALSAAIVEVKE